MKKAYTKPYIAVESFQLDAAIASACSTTGATPIHYGESSCGYDEISSGYWEYFNLNNCEVDLTGPGDDGSDTICYHGPMLSFNQMFIAS